MIALFTVAMSPKSGEMVAQTLSSGHIAEGPLVKEFESALGDFLLAPNVVTVNSGTTALQLALHLAGARLGTSVVSTPMTCAATNLAILHTGAQIIWADIDPVTGLIDPISVARVCRLDTVAVMAVDWAGEPCDIHNLRRAAPGCAIVSDSAHAFGVVHNEAPDYICYSFQAIKHLTTGDGGAVVIREGYVAEAAKLVRWFGIDRSEERSDFRIESDIAVPGHKWHMNDISATIGLANLAEVATVLQKHRDNAAFYDSTVSGFYRPAHQGSAESSYWLYTVLLPQEGLREEFMKFMASRGIQVSAVHARNDKHSCFSEAILKGELIGTKSFSSRQVNIPVHSALDEVDRDRIVEAMRSFSLVAA